MRIGVRRRFARRGVERGIVEIAGDEARRETERAAAFDHQQGIVATRAAAALERHRRDLRPDLETHGVCQLFLNAHAEPLQQAESIVAALAFHELLGPGAHRRIRVGIGAFDVACEIGRLLGRVAERQGPREFLDRRQLRRYAEMLELDRADQLQDLRRAVERRDRNRIAKRIVDPTDVGCRFDHQTGVKKSQVVAVPRPEHEPVVTERHLLGIIVTSAVDDLESAHVSGIMPEAARGCTCAEFFSAQGRCNRTVTNTSRAPAIIPTTSQGGES